MRASLTFTWALGLGTALLWSGCGGDDDSKKNPGGAGGSAGQQSGGSAGSSKGGGGGKGGSAGKGGGASSAGKGGGAGSAGSDASGGAGGDGSAGEAGASNGGAGGSSGASGSNAGGEAGASSGGSGAAGESGASGQGGAPGQGGAAGDAGAAGAGGEQNLPLQAFSNQPLWATASTCGAITALYFENATELHNRFSNDPLIMPSYASQGVDFLPFPGTAVYPRIMRGQDAQIALPGHDGLLGNGSSPVAASDLNGRALHAEFLVPVTAVGVWVNQGDGGALEAYDASDTLILSAPLASGGFAGITSPAEIARVRILCTFNADIRCGWYGFQFCDP